MTEEQNKLTTLAELPKAEKCSSKDKVKLFVGKNRQFFAGVLAGLALFGGVLTISHIQQLSAENAALRAALATLAIETGRPTEIVLNEILVVVHGDLEMGDNATIDGNVITDMIEAGKINVEGDVVIGQLPPRSSAGDVITLEQK